MLAKEPDRRPTMLEVAQQARSGARRARSAAAMRRGRRPTPRSVRVLSRVARTPSRPCRVVSSPGSRPTESLTWRSSPGAGSTRSARSAVARRAALLFVDQPRRRPRRERRDGVRGDDRHAGGDRGRDRHRRGRATSPPRTARCDRAELAARARRRAAAVRPPCFAPRTPTPGRGPRAHATVAPRAPRNAPATPRRGSKRRPRRHHRSVLVKPAASSDRAPCWPRHVGQRSRSPMQPRPTRAASRPRRARSPSGPRVSRRRRLPEGDRRVQGGVRHRAEPCPAVQPRPGIPARGQLRRRGADVPALPRDQPGAEGSERWPRPTSPASSGACTSSRCTSRSGRRRSARRRSRPSRG